MKNGTLTKSYAALLRRNKKLGESRDYWQGQTRRTKRVTTDKKAVEKAAKGLVKGVTAGDGWKKALTWSPIAMRKNTGGFDIASPANVKQAMFDGRSWDRKLNDTLSTPAGAADAVTWGRLWNACEWAVQRERPGLKAGSEDFYKETAKRFSEVIDQTQVVDGVLQRSNIMRARSDTAKQATSFINNCPQLILDWHTSAELFDVLLAICNL